MAAISGPRSAYPSLPILQLLNKEIPQISINFTTGKYVFSTPVKQQRLQLVLDTITEGIAMEALAGGLAVGAIGAVALAVAEEGGAALSLAGAIVGVILGVGSCVCGKVGGVVGGAVIEGAMKLHKINREVTTISRNSNRIMNLLFRTASNLNPEQGLPFYCPISNQLMHIPVSTGCNADRDVNGKIIIDPDGNVSRIAFPHIFDYNALRNHLKISNRCPFAGCEEVLNKEEIFFEYEVREGVHEAVNEAVRWITLREPKDVDYSKLEPALLKNVEEIATRLEEGTSTGDDLSLLSHLTRKHGEEYNDRVDRVVSDLLDIVKNSKYDDAEDKMIAREAILKLGRVYHIKLIKLLRHKDIN